LQRTEWPQRQILLQIDLNQATYQAFLNCINSFQGLETESEMQSAQGVSVSTMTSKVSLERFVYNLGVLDGLIGEKVSKKGEWKGGEFDPSRKDFNSFKYWASLVKWLNDVEFFKSPRRTAHL
jgi:hypothetical protein